MYLAARVYGTTGMQQPVTQLVPAGHEVGSMPPAPQGT
jgi:hypothetical protein